VISGVTNLYLNVFVLVVQLFMAALKELAPIQSFYWQSRFLARIEDTRALKPIR
jgi:hypothetical protein